jgi:hypothetical protein
LSWQAWVQSVLTFATIHISNRTVCSMWAPCQLTDGHKTTQMGSSLMLLQHNGDHGEAFSCWTVTTDETWVFHDTPKNKVKSMMWTHLYSPVKEKFTTVHSPKKVMTVFCDVYTESFWLISHSMVNNKCSCLPRSSKDTPGGYMAKLTRILTIVLLLHANGQPHSTNATTNFLKFCGWKNSSTSNTQTWFPLLDFHLLPKTKHHTRG